MFDDDEVPSDENENVGIDTFGDEVRAMVEEFIESQDSDTEQSREKWMVELARHLGIGE